MKIKFILPFFFLLFSFYSKYLSANDTKEILNSKLLIGANDTIVVDIKNAIKTIFSTDSSYIDIPLYIKSSQLITALDIQFQFNESKLTYSIINDAVPGYLSSITNYRNTTDLFLVYGAYIANVNSNIATNVTLAYIRFKFKTSCNFQLNSSDFYNPLTLLNGVICSSKFTRLNATNIPIADFNNGALCTNSNVQFTDLSAVSGGTITNWNWNFGNGQTSNTQNPISTYTASGTYTASLIVKENTGCADTITKQLVIESPPISSFSYTLDCLKDSVYFTNLSSIGSGTISNSTWNFGDLETSSSVNPSHYYNSGGTYTVSLTSISAGSCVNTYTLAVVLDKPIANFVASSINSCIGSTLSFSNTSSYATGVITSWNWDFGDGNTSSIQSPNYTYTTPGIYTVTLVSSSASGCSGSATQIININVNPSIQFSGNILTGCATQTVNFLNASSPTSGSQYTWNFGDNGTSSIQNPTHVYSNPGTYSVKLIITTANGCVDSLIKLSYISIYDLPITNFSASNNCVNSSINFTNSTSISTGTITSWNWNFGDGNSNNTQNPIYSYSVAGTYVVNLTAVSNNGCQSSSSNTVLINAKPIVQFSANISSGCAPLSLNFNDLSTSTTSGSTYLWNFGDNATSSQQNPAHLYTSTGSYTVKLYVTSPSGCNDSLIKTAYIVVNPSPIANFSNTSSCLNSVSSFTDNSSGLVTSWSWNFGDGNTSIIQNPSHVYSTPGTFSVTLFVLNSSGCSSSITKSVTINNKPLVQFTADSLVGCSPAVINFTNQSTASLGSTNIWYFGDNSTSNLQNPSHTYSVSGNYTIKLIVSESGGCSDSLEKINYISIINSPTALFTVSNNTVNLPNAVISFSNTSTNYTNVEWFFGDSQNSNVNNPNHNYTDVGVYEVCLKAYNSNLCYNEFCDNIYVKASNIVAIPSTFTPNSDNINDILRVKGGPFQEMEFRIFNEWGNLIFSSSSQNDGWDGKFKGDNQPTGIYEYTLKGTTIENKIVNLYGVVKLIR